MEIIEGYIKFYNLQDWWTNTFSDEQKEIMVKRFSPMNENTGCLIHNEITDCNQPITTFLHILSRWFDNKKNIEIYEKIRAKLNETALKSKSRSPGNLRGRHYTTYVDDVKSLKRQKKHQEAEALLLELISRVEAEALSTNFDPPPWYYEQLATIYRKERKYGDLIEILTRYCNFCKGHQYEISLIKPKIERAKLLKINYDKKLKSKTD